MKLISLITVNFNQPALTEDLLNSVFSKNLYPSLEIIVVDNGSLKDPVPNWVKKYPNATFIRSEKNLGFAGGNNLAIGRANGSYLFLINNDAEVTENAIAELSRTLDKDPQIGIVSPKILYYNSSVIQYAGYTPLNYVTGRNKCIGQFQVDKGQFDNTGGPTAYAHGAAMMVRREAVDAAGLMAENFFLYYEELDWCERIKKKGYTIWVQPHAVIYHKESMSVGKQSSLKEYYMTRNRMLLVRKHAASFNYFFFLFYFILIAFPVAIFRHLKNGQGYLVPVMFKAIWWNVTNKTNSDKHYVPPPYK